MTGAIMARKQAGPNKGKTGLAPKTIAVKSSGEWAAWLDGLAEHYRTTVSGVIDRALTEWAEAEGYPVRPPRRTP